MSAAVFNLQLADVVATSAEVAATPKRGAKTSALAALLQRAEPEAVAPVVWWLSGELSQRQIGVGLATLKEAPDPAPEPSLTVAGVEAALERIGGASGPGSATVKRDGVRELFAAATEEEQRFLRALLSGGLRQGSLAGVMADAVAEAAAVPKVAVKRALGVHGDLAAIAAQALEGGEVALAAIRIAVGRPLAPMLAATAADVAAAMEKVGGPAYVDHKLDGARVQVHRDGEEVRVFTRTLDDVTERLPEVVRLARALPAAGLVLDAEAIALREDGRPEPFQVTASRFGTSRDRAAPLAVRVFDVLHRDGEDLLDLPLSERDAVLQELVPLEHRIARRLVQDAHEAVAVAEEALAAGHEGVVVKAPEGPYAAGRRATGWLKVKPVHTFDLVVLGAEWGHGRRRGTLSNLHLGARTEDGFAMVGKTFKGLTDELLAWQTQELLAREERREGIAVLVRPELVVEIAVDGVQTSRRYASGAALRFARVKRYRPDKTAAEADTLTDLLALRDGA